MNKVCRDLLFVWSPGSEGEKLPDGKGVEANKVMDRLRDLGILIHATYNHKCGIQPLDYTQPQASSNGARHVMVLVAYKETVRNDDSGMDLFWSTSSLNSVGRLVAEL